MVLTEAKAASLLSGIRGSVRLPRPYVPESIVPTPKQMAFLLSKEPEVLYGGSAGGGKSIALLMAALQYVDVPGYNALLLRRTYADLSKPDALIPVSHEWLRPTDAHWDEQKKQWRFPSGATLSFGYLDSENDKYHFQGAQYQFVGFDELTQFTETSYVYVAFSRGRRRVDSIVPIRVRAASNPGGIGHEWVRDRFLTTRSPNRRFVPAGLKDNPYLDKATYTQSLMELDPVTRAQLLNGDWDVRPSGGFFKREWFDVIDAAPVDLTAIRFWDLAATDAKEGTDPDWTAGALLARDSESGYVYILDMRHRRGTPHDVEQLIRATANDDGRDVEIYFEQEPGSAGKALVDQYRRRVLSDRSVRVLSAAQRGSKTSLASHLSSQTEARNVKVLRGDWNRAMFDEFDGFPQAAHDDQVDAASSAYYVLSGEAWLARNQKRRVSAGTREYFERRTTTCECGNPIYFQVDEEEKLCIRCGRANRRGQQIYHSNGNGHATAVMELVAVTCPSCLLSFNSAEQEQYECQRCGNVW